MSSLVQIVYSLKIRVGPYLIRSLKNVDDEGERERERGGGAAPTQQVNYSDSMSPHNIHPPPLLKIFFEYQIKF